MDKIIDTFRPFIDSLPHVDYLHSRKFGWVYVRQTPEREEPQFLQTAENLLCALVGDFFDQAEGRSAREAADNALEAMQPFLQQLSPAIAEYARAAMEVYAKADTWIIR